MGRCASPCLGDLDPNAYRRQLDAALGAVRRARRRRRAAARRARPPDRRGRRRPPLRARGGAAAPPRAAGLAARAPGGHAARHARRPRLVLARHPVKERYDAFWIVAGPGGRLGAAAGLERARGAHRGRAGTAPRRGGPGRCRQRSTSADRRGLAGRARAARAAARPGARARARCCASWSAPRRPRRPPRQPPSVEAPLPGARVARAENGFVVEPPQRQSDDRLPSSASSYSLPSASIS